VSKASVVSDSTLLAKRFCDLATVSGGKERIMRLLNVTEAADRLGLSTATVRAWIWKREIEVVRLGRSVRIKEETLEDLIERGTTPAELKRLK
jgi:excisionase family DNA binding protein